MPHLQTWACIRSIGWRVTTQLAGPHLQSFGFHRSGCVGARAFPSSQVTLMLLSGNYTLGTVGVVLYNLENALPYPSPMIRLYFVILWGWGFTDEEASSERLWLLKPPSQWQAHLGIRASHSYCLNLLTLSREVFSFILPWAVSSKL